jgi:NADPH:quinone reductase-like Zn-dependent oxidoreductase
MAALAYGPLDGLTPIDAPLPVPGRGEVRVRVVASALDPADYKVVLGTMKFSTQGGRISVRVADGF